MSQDIRTYLEAAVKNGAADLFIVSGLPVSMKLDGRIVRQDETMVMPEEANRLISQIYELAGRSMDHYLACGDDDYSVSVKGLARFRVSAYRQRGSMAAVVRVVAFGIPDYRALSIPEEVMKLSTKTRGLVLVTGPAGSGKSTTLACVVDAINANRNAHIITIEDPIEYLHRNKVGVVSQREVATDTESYVTALRACLRQAPDVILLGEMRDLETIRIAMTAAETGHLVISTLHTVGAVNTIDRIIDVFPASQQQQIRVQLAMVLQTVVSQQLVPGVDGKLVPAFEIMHLNNAIRSMIRDAKLHQIDGVLQTSAAEGMMSMDGCLLSLFQQKKISADTAVNYSYNPAQMERRVGGAR